MALERARQPEPRRKRRVRNSLRLGLRDAALGPHPVARRGDLVFLLYARVVPRVILHAVVALATASAIFLVSGGIYYALFNTHNNLHTLASNMAWATGVARPTDLASIISSFATSETLFPASMMVVAAVALIPSPQRESFAAIRPLCVLLWLIGVIGWAAWIVKAPIPHMRYLWPALPAAWLCGVLLVVDWLMALRPGRGRVLLHTAILSVGATQFALSFRQVAYGDSLKLVYAARWSPIAGFQPFHARQDQDRVASIVAGLPADAQVYALVPPVSYPITWLTGREIRPALESASPPSGRGDQYLILFPSDKSIWRPTLETLNWIEGNATPHSRFDDYSVYGLRPMRHHMARPTLNIERHVRDVRANREFRNLSSEPN